MAGRDGRFGLRRRLAAVQAAEDHLEVDGMVQMNVCSQMANATIVHKSQMANICICGNDGSCEQLRFVNNGKGA